MRNLKEKKSFKKQIKKYKHHHDVLLALKEVVNSLVRGQPIDKKYRNHQLKGRFAGKNEMHLKPDVLLIYEEIEDTEIILIAIGSHSDLFE